MLHFYPSAANKPCCGPEAGAAGRQAAHEVLGLRGDALRTAVQGSQGERDETTSTWYPFDHIRILIGIAQLPDRDQQPHIFRVLGGVSGFHATPQALRPSIQPSHRFQLLSIQHPLHLCLSLIPALMVHCVWCRRARGRARWRGTAWCSTGRATPSATTDGSSRPRGASRYIDRHTILCRSQGHTNTILCESNRRWKCVWKIPLV